MLISSLSHISVKLLPPPIYIFWPPSKSNKRLTSIISIVIKGIMDMGNNETMDLEDIMEINTIEIGCKLEVRNSCWLCSIIVR